MSMRFRIVFATVVVVVVVYLTTTSSTVDRLVIENCFDDADDDLLSGWLDDRGRPGSAIVPCGNATAVLSAIRFAAATTTADGTEDAVVAVVTFGLASALLRAASASSSASAVGWTVYGPDRWQHFGSVYHGGDGYDVVDDDNDECPGRRSSDQEDTKSQIYLLDRDLYPVTRRTKRSHVNHIVGRGSSSGCTVPSWKTHLQSLLRDLDLPSEGNVAAQHSPVTIYLYHEDGGQRMTARNREPTLRRASLVVHRRQEDFALIKCRETAKNICVDRLTISKKFIRIGVMQMPPFMMMRRDDDGEIEHYGFLVDMIVVLAAKLNFNYTLITQDSYGRKLPNGSWFGAMQAILDDRIDLIVADFSKTPSRAEVVDFTIPFMQGSKGVVIQRAMEVPTVGDLLRTHLRPFHWTIWLVLLATLLLSTLLLTHAAAPSPASLDQATTTDQTNQQGLRLFRRRKKDKNGNAAAVPSTSDPPETWWSIFFQILGIFCQQGCSLSPTLTSGRIILYTVCLTSLATYNFYTSVFISFTTVTKRPVEMNSLSDVIMDPSYDIGFQRNMGAEDVFQSSDKLVYRRAWRRIQQKANLSYVSNVTEGINRAYAEKFAFIDEMSMLQWYVAGNCSLKLLHNHILTEGYHLVLPKGSNDTFLFDMYLKRLQESGMVNRFLGNHMPQTTVDYCTDVNTLEAVGLDRMGSLFLCLAIGTILTVVSLWLEKLAPETDTSKTVTVQVKRF